MLTTAAAPSPGPCWSSVGVWAAALATAKRLGARTTGYDVRPEVAEQVRSVFQWLEPRYAEAAGEGQLRP